MKASTLKRILGIVKSLGESLEQLVVEMESRKDGRPVRRRGYDDIIGHERFKELSDKLCEGGVTFRDAAAELGVNENRLIRAFRHAGLKVEITHCLDCGEAIEQPDRTGTHGPTRKYCEKCATARKRASVRAYRGRGVPKKTFTCTICGKAFEVGRVRGAPRYCSEECRNEGHRQSRAKYREAHKDDEKVVAPRKRGRGVAIRVVGSAARCTTVEEQRSQVEHDMTLPASERYEASKRWTAEMRKYAEQLWREKNRGNWEA